LLGGQLKVTEVVQVLMGRGPRGEAF
jgi:hypothetical protein